ncbi:protein NETWORKED 4A-like [Quercus robur]|uniref:protein NETWORKED 4A-like n=1 Tax=Quercus robur TaxID=38942 RepID=UPI0021635770|nr:protein NETWORKED 4A-like [Quercus robur]XP_050250981.1 protein NETWORKED 4A-like [Quercus robur]
MEPTESKKSNLCWWDSHISPENSKWLAENLEVMGQNVKEMLNLIQADGDHLVENAELNGQKRQLVADVGEFHRMYQSLAERYDHVTEALRKSLPSELQMQGFGSSEFGSGQGSPLLTPDQKSGFHSSGHQAINSDVSLSSGAGSSVLSLKEGIESSPSSFSSDSETEPFNLTLNNYSSPPMDFDGKVLHHKISEMETEVSSMKEKFWTARKDNMDNMLKVGEKCSYEEMLGRISRSEEELRVSNLQLQLSEKEIARLKSQLEKGKSAIVLVESMQAQLECVQEDIKMREADLKLERGRVLELQNQIAELETCISDSSNQIRRLVEESEVTRERLKGSDEEIVKLRLELVNRTSEGTYELQGELEVAREEIAMLQAQLDSGKRKALELHESIERYKTSVSSRDIEVRELKLALSDAQEQFSREKAHLQCDISSLSEKQTLFDSTLKEWELRSGSLENEIRQCEAEKVELKGLHVAHEMALQSEINQLKDELIERRENVEILNKDFDGLKLKFDMLMAEKDGLNAKLHTLVAEVNSRDSQIQQMEGHLGQLRQEHVELIAEGKSAQNLVDELRLKVEELEKEVDSQRVLISDGAEEKREVIRQLCFSLEHYRSWYQELRKAFIVHKQHAVLAS